MKAQESFLAWLKTNLGNYDALVLDIDGVLLMRGLPLPGSRELLDMIRVENIPFSLLTNAANVTVKNRRETLAKGRLFIDPGLITSSGHPLKEIVSSENLAGSQFFIMGSLAQYARSAGLLVTRNGDELADCSGVIIGEGKYDWQNAINRVVNFFIQRREAPFIVPNPDRYFPSTGGEIRVASGGVARFIENILLNYGVEKKGIYLGKPYSPIFRFNHDKMEKKLALPLKPERVLMLGDSLHGDIQGAKNFGYAAALILTGATTEKLVTSSSMKPDFLFSKL